MAQLISWSSLWMYKNYHLFTNLIVYHNLTNHLTRVWIMNRIELILHVVSYYFWRPYSYLQVLIFQVKQMTIHKGVLWAPFKYTFTIRNETQIITNRPPFYFQILLITLYCNTLIQTWLLWLGYFNVNLLLQQLNSNIRSLQRLH